VLWQTWWLAVCGLAVGIPLGILTGRAAWRIVARQIGTSASPFLPAAAILVVVPAVVIVAAATAAVPAWMASRVTPNALRSE
jgi:ABC-type antimicrobial peptide transport system permease subunit